MDGISSLVDVMAEAIGRNPVLSALIAAAAAAGGAWAMGMASKLRAAERVMKSQHNVLDEVDLRAFREQVVPPRRRQAWDEYVADVRRRFKVVRKGHLYLWHDREHGVQPPRSTPNFEPPDGTPYTIENDPGGGHFRAYLMALGDSDQVGAFRHLAEGVEVGSPICMSIYGAALLKGDVPGKAPSPEGFEWLERAVAAGRDCTELGMELIEHGRNAAERERGLAMVEKELRAGAAPLTAIELARILAEGRHGVPRDVEAATRVALLSAPYWRRLLARLGVSQQGWMHRQVDDITRAEAAMTPRAVEAGRKDMARALRRRAAR
jgi:hypothetical protein